MGSNWIGLLVPPGTAYRIHDVMPRWVYLFSFFLLLLFSTESCSASLKMAANFFDPNNNRERASNEKNEIQSVRRMKWKLRRTWTLAANGKSGAARRYYSSSSSSVPTNCPKMKCLFACGIAKRTTQSFLIRDSLEKNENAITWMVNGMCRKYQHKMLHTAIIII